MSTAPARCTSYRPANAANGLHTAMVYVDGNPVDRLSNNGRVAMQLDAGHHIVQIGRHQTSVTLAAGETAFLRYRYGWALFNLIPFDAGQLQPVDQALAESELGTAQ